MEVSWENVLQDQVSKEEEASSSSLPSPSPELSPAQAWSHEHSADSGSLPPPSLELPRAQTWSLEQPFQHRPRNDKDNTATTNSTSLPSPPLDLSIESPWIESETNVFDSLFESHTGHSFSECGTTAFSGLELDAFQSDFGHGISDSCTKSEYGAMSSSLGAGVELNADLPVDDLMAFFMSAEDLVQALVTPVSDLIMARDINDKATPATPLCVRLDDLFVETATQNEKIDQDNPTAIACFPSPQGTASAALVPAAAARRVRFDMTPYIKLLDPTRVTGPPKEADEEHIDDIMRNARWEYRWDKDLRQEHKLAKWASFNAHLHAAFPVDDDDEQATDEQQSDQFSIEDCSTKKRSIDSDDTNDVLADERPTKKSRVAEHASSDSSSCNSSSSDITVDQLGVKEPLINTDTTIDYPDGADTTNDQPFDMVSAIKMHVVTESQAEDFLALSQHPDFDEMIKDDEIGRSYRLFRWDLYYPALQTEELPEDEISQKDADDLEC